MKMTAQVLQGPELILDYLCWVVSRHKEGEPAIPKCGTPL